MLAHQEPSFEEFLLQVTQQMWCLDVPHNSITTLQPKKLLVRLVTQWLAERRLVVVRGETGLREEACGFRGKKVGWEMSWKQEKPNLHLGG